MTLKFGVLGASESPYVRRLLAAAEKHARIAEVTCFRFNELQVACQEERSDAGPLSELDVLLVRTMPLGSLEQVIFRMDCLQVLEANGVRIINTPKSLEVAIDKWLTLHRLQQAGVPVPKTIACQDRDAAIQAWELLGGDVVVKPLFGGEGRGIIRVSDKDMAWRVFSTLQQLDSVCYLQQFQPHMGYDVRVLFVGERHFCMRRYADDGWRTNLAQGNQAGPHQLSDHELALAEKARLAVGADVAGVDLLPCQDGKLMVLEVNAVPGWIGLEKVVQCDLAELVVNYAIENLN